MKLLFFTGEDCAACKVMKKLLQEINFDVIIEEIDVDERPDYVAGFGITSLPTLLLIDDGSWIESQVGAVSKQKLIEKFEPFIRIKENK